MCSSDLMGSYATDPTNRALAAGITGAANIVSDRMAGMSSIIEKLKSSTHTGLVDTIKQANSLLPELGRINQQIISATSPGNTSPSADLLDERDRILAQAQLAPDRCLQRSRSVFVVRVVKNASHPMRARPVLSSSAVLVAV